MHKLIVLIGGAVASLAALAGTDEGIAAYNAGNYAVALKEFSAAAGSGSAQGKHLLASLYYQGHGVPLDKAKAAALFSEAAAADYRPSLANLALMYASGDGVPQDFAQAARWYKASAEAGLPRAQNEYGLLFAQGHGVALDYVQAYAWIDMPANAGEPQAIKNRAQLMQILDASSLQRARKLAAVYAAKYQRAR